MPASTHNYSQPSSIQRTSSPKTALYYNTNYTPSIPNPNLYRRRINLLLHFIRSNTNSNTNYYHPMRQPNRTTKRGPLLFILYTDRITATPNRINPYPKPHRLTKSLTNSILSPNTIQFLIQHLPMTSMHNSIYTHVEAPIAGSIVLAAILLKLGGYGILRITTILNPLTSYFNLSTPDRPEITHRILLHQPHSFSNRSCPYPNTMKLYRSHSPNSCPRPHIISTILPSKFKLRTNPQHGVGS
ncbi:hypothetical protein HPG69_016215 [Diceros bicornis minor]|uniref:NADH:ubiquinone reductase (H(+)-translocating) n=1 Tax=Diceros bicornis minor TaxID=77932 RepID=A0A7J7FIU4_DICBM|nr:hypothetical protein HPG69_016215 [Diceros bicornis minor]